MKSLKSAYLSARVSQKSKERLEFLAVFETRSLSQVVGWAIEEGLPLLERKWAEKYGDAFEPPKDANPYVDTKEYLSRNPYNAKKIAANQRKEQSALRRFIKMENAQQKQKP